MKTMSAYEFMKKAKKMAAEWIANRYSEENKTVAIAWTDVFTVWQAKILKNHKIIVAAPTPDNYMFEITFNGETGDIYFDAYDKIENKCIKQEGD